MEERNVKTVALEIDCEQLDAAVEKANRLVALLQEAADLIDSLSRN